MTNIETKLMLSFMALAVLIGVATIIIITSSTVFDYYLNKKIDFNHKEIVQAIDHSTQIELELIDAVNKVLKKKHIQAPDTNCEAIATFLDSLEKSRRNRNKKGSELK